MQHHAYHEKRLEPRERRLLGSLRLYKPEDANTDGDRPDKKVQEQVGFQRAETKSCHLRMGKEMPAWSLGREDWCTRWSGISGMCRGGCSESCIDCTAAGVIGSAVAQRTSISAFAHGLDALGRVAESARRRPSATISRTIALPQCCKHDTRRAERCSEWPDHGWQASASETADDGLSRVQIFRIT